MSQPKAGQEQEYPGYNISGADKGPGSIEDGIQFLKSFEKIVIHPRCKGTINDFSNYRFKQDKLTREILPVPIDKQNHSVDSARYALFEFIKGEYSILDVFKNK
jgi:phage terminase large subunit